MLAVFTAAPLIAALIMPEVRGRDLAALESAC